MLLLQDGTLSLIHVPLNLYTNFLQPILQVLLPPSQDPSQSISDGVAVDCPKHGFLNISVTPIECSIACNSAWAKSVFEPAIQRLPKDQAKTVAISQDTYAALSVFGSGVDAGSRVVDLTSPLALANIPIFFITTYCEFVLARGCPVEFWSTGTVSTLKLPNANPVTDIANRLRLHPRAE